MSTYHVLATVLGAVDKSVNTIAAVWLYSVHDQCVVNFC